MSVGPNPIANNGNQYLDFLTPPDLATGNYASGKRSLNPAALTATTPGAALLLDNVVSFQVQALKSTTSPRVPEDVNFDTMNSNPGYNVSAVSVTMRVWDPKTRQSRQTTFMVDM
jgi:hypothetical protein